MYLQNQGKFDDAIVDFTRAIERDPNYFVAYANRGFTLLQMENPTAAEADFSQSLRINPQQAFVYNLRAQAKVARGDMAGAIKDQQAAVELSPEGSGGAGRSGVCDVLCRRLSGALAPIDAALGIDPEFKHLNPWKIVVLQRLGKTNGLKDQFKESLAKDPKAADVGRPSDRLPPGQRIRRPTARGRPNRQGSAEDGPNVRGLLLHRPDPGGRRQNERGGRHVSAGPRDKVPPAFGLSRGSVGTQEAQSGSAGQVQSPAIPRPEVPGTASRQASVEIRLRSLTVSAAIAGSTVPLTRHRQPVQRPDRRS